LSGTGMAGAHTLRDLERCSKLALLILLLTQAIPHQGFGQGAQPIRVMFLSRGIPVRAAGEGMLSADPAIDVTPIPVSGGYMIEKQYPVINRFLRIYMPRRYRDLVEGYDMVTLYEAPCGSAAQTNVFFDRKWVTWFRDGVKINGMSLEMWGGDASWGGMGEGSFTSWGDTVLDEILPFNSLGGYIHGQALPHRPLFRDPNHPLARLPWKEAGPIEVCNLVSVKEGADLIAEAVGGPTDRHPWIGMWRVGRGTCLGETQVFGSTTSNSSRTSGSISST